MFDLRSSRSLLKGTDVIISGPYQCVKYVHLIMYGFKSTEKVITEIKTLPTVFSAGFEVKGHW